ncbi:methyltransferase [Tunturiibacter lichenicola]|uniref:methyltransferase n=1 Tax=Tunturiibacter lichenicola TaxID=2051959 RepID=UPI003D9AB9B3
MASRSALPKRCLRRIRLFHRHKLVDIGGGHGRIFTEILKRNPQMHGILFNLPHALEGARKAIAQAELADRCEVISGDFFVSVPAGGGTCMLFFAQGEATHS